MPPKTPSISGATAGKPKTPEDPPADPDDTFTDAEEVERPPAEDPLTTPTPFGGMTTRSADKGSTSGASADAGKASTDKAVKAAAQKKIQATVELARENARALKQFQKGLDTCLADAANDRMKQAQDHMDLSNRVDGLQASINNLDTRFTKSDEQLGNIQQLLIDLAEQRQGDTIASTPAHRGTGARPRDGRLSNILASGGALGQGIRAASPERIQPGIAGRIGQLQSNVANGRTHEQQESLELTRQMSGRQNHNGQNQSQPPVTANTVADGQTGRQIPIITVSTISTTAAGNMDTVVSTVHQQPHGMATTDPVDQPDPIDDWYEQQRIRLNLPPQAVDYGNTTFVPATSSKSVRFNPPDPVNTTVDLDAEMAAVYARRGVDLNQLQNEGRSNSRPTGQPRPAGPEPDPMGTGVYGGYHIPPADMNNSMFLNQSTAGFRQGTNSTRQGVSNDPEYDNMFGNRNSDTPEFFSRVPRYNPYRPTGASGFEQIYGVNAKELTQVTNRVEYLEDSLEWDVFISSIQRMGQFARAMTDYGYKIIIFEKIRVPNLDKHLIDPDRHMNISLVDYIMKVKSLVAPPYNKDALEIAYRKCVQKPGMPLDIYWLHKFQALQKYIDNGGMVGPEEYYKDLVRGLLSKKLQKLVWGSEHKNNFTRMRQFIIDAGAELQKKYLEGLTSEAHARGTDTLHTELKQKGSNKQQVTVNALHEINAVNAKSFPNRRFKGKSNFGSRRPLGKDDCFYCRKKGHWAKDCPKKSFGHDRAKRVRRANKYLNACGAAYRIDPQGELLVDSAKLSNLEAEYDSESESEEETDPYAIPGEVDSSENDLVELNAVPRSKRRPRFTRKGRKSYRKGFSGKRKFYRKNKDGSLHLVEVDVDDGNENFPWDEADEDESQKENQPPSSVENIPAQNVEATVTAENHLNVIGTLTTDFSPYEQDFSLYESDEDNLYSLQVDPEEDVYTPETTTGKVAVLGDPEDQTKKRFETRDQDKEEELNLVNFTYPDNKSTDHQEEMLAETARILRLIDDQVDPEEEPLRPPDLPIDSEAL